jgi:hypothetical protein
MPALLFEGMNSALMGYVRKGNPMITNTQIERSIRFVAPVVASRFENQIVFKRTQVIAEGGTVCDFRYYEVRCDSKKPNH